MYSKEQREVAVKLYIKYRFKASKVCNHLGYPDRRMLKKWYEEYLKSDNKIIVNHARKPKYSKEEREKAVAYYLEHGKNITVTVKDLGYPCRSVLSNWICEDVKNHQPFVLKGKTLVKYTEEEKKAAALDVAIREETVTDISKKTKASRASLYNWKEEFISPELENKINNDSLSEIDELKKEVDQLKKEIYRLNMEKDVLEKAAELIKKDRDIDINHLTNKEKTIIINVLKSKYKLSELLTILNISKSSYFYSVKALSIDKYHDIKAKINNIFDNSYKSYGYRRIKNSLKNEGINISEKVIRRLMKEQNLSVISIKKKKYSSYIGEISPAVPNLLNRNFKADKPNEKLLTDLTEFSINDDKVYLSSMIDCFDGFITSWTIGLSPNATLVNTMLIDVINRLKDDEKPIIHSDRGCHYRWPDWIKLMEDNGLTRSMSKKGCSPDNSACEGFFGRLKNEFFYNRSWTNISTEDFIKRLNDYIIWYNTKRIKESLGYMSPIDYRKSLGLSW